jgi:hypothetical protein
LSASGIADQNNTQDVKELTPEFYYLPDFLSNCNAMPMGTRQDGRVVDDVELPPWARGSAREFIMLHRRALESEYVVYGVLVCDMIRHLCPHFPQLAWALLFSHPSCGCRQLNQVIITDDGTVIITCFEPLTSVIVC